MQPRLSVFIASSLDGFIASTDGSLDWLEASGADGEDYGYQALMESVDALAMGRGTYDHIAHLDPLPFGGKPVFVFTHNPPAAREGVSFWNSSPRVAHKHWGELGFERVYVDGGFLISSFLREGLIDDLLLTKVPLLLGDGLPLFHPIPRQTELDLVKVEAFPSGMVNLRYERRPE